MTRNATTIRIWCLALLLSVTSMGTWGERTEDSRIRKEFTNENAPPEIYFYMFMSRIRSRPVEPDQLISQGISHEDIVASIIKRMGVSHNDADSVSSYFRDLQVDISTEIDDAMRRIACPTHKPRPKGRELYPIYNEFDEIRQAVHAKYLAIAAAEMSRMGYDHFRDMLTRASGGFGVIFSEHRRPEGTDTARKEQNLEALCNRLEMKQYE